MGEEQVVYDTYGFLYMIRFSNYINGDFVNPINQTFISGKMLNA